MKIMTRPGCSHTHSSHSFPLNMLHTRVRMENKTEKGNDNWNQVKKHKNSEFFTTQHNKIQYNILSECVCVHVVCIAHFPIQVICLSGFISAWDCIQDIASQRPG